VLIRLVPDTGYLMRVYVHTAASGDVLSRLQVRVNGLPPAHRGIDWGADGVPSVWWIVEHAGVTQGEGLMRLTLTIRPEGEESGDSSGDEDLRPGEIARQIAFSRMTFDPYP
jgi:hypothetical protein